MKDSDFKASNMVAGLILFGIGCISIGYALAKIVNDLEGGAPLAAVGAVCAALSSVIFSRANLPKK